MAKKKFVKKQIEKMRALAFTEIPQKIAANPGLQLEQYLNECRLALNTIAVGALTGGEYVESKKSKDDNKSFKMKFCHTLPTKKDLAEICEIMNAFIGTVENPFLARFVVQQPEGQQAGEDMEIPDRNLQVATVGTNIPTIEKINKKKLEKYIFGKDGSPSICKMLLTSIDCIQIASLGEDLRKKENRNKMLIIGGIALLLTGAAIAGVCIYKHHKSGDEIDDLIDEINSADPITDIGDDDAPVVSIIA